MLKKIKKIIPTSFKDFIVDLLEIKGRYFPKEHKGYPHLDLSPTQAYPHGIIFFNVITNGQIKNFQHQTWRKNSNKIVHGKIKTDKVHCSKITP